MLVLQLVRSSINKYLQHQMNQGLKKKSNLKLFKSNDHLKTRIDSVQMFGFINDHVE